MADDERSVLLDRIEGDLAGVERALARLDAGTYFACEICGGAIADETLVADPMGGRCTSCAGVVVADAAPADAAPDAADAADADPADADPADAAPGAPDPA